MAQASLAPQAGNPESKPKMPLDRVQREAVNAPEGPMLVIGGPGTGKTHTLHARILKLLESGARGNTITYLTLNARSAEAARRELEKYTDASNIYTGTIHSMASFFLRQHGAGVLRISPNFTIWDNNDTTAIIREITQRPELELGDKVMGTEIRKLISWHAYNRALSPDQQRPTDHDKGYWYNIVDAYQAEKRLQNALDLSDLIPAAVAALERDPRARSAWNAIRTKHLLVDDFQDITPIQYKFISLLTGPTKSIAIATDPNQSIYAWQGSDHRLLEQFRLTHNRAEQHLLRINHRSVGAITDMSDAMTNCNALSGLFASYLTAIRPDGEMPRSIIYEATNRKMDQMIIDEVSEVVKQKKLQWEDIAFLYLRKDTGERLTTTLSARGIPYTRAGDTENSIHGETRAIIAMLKIAINPKDRAAFAIAASEPDGTRRIYLNPTDAKNIGNLARQNATDLVQASREYIPQLKRSSPLGKTLRYVVKTQIALARMLDDPKQTLNNICKEAQHQLHENEGSGYLPNPAPDTHRMLINSETCDRRATENNRQHLARYLELIAQAPYPEHRDAENEDPTTHRQGITLSTIHASKGMQWKAIWIIDAGEDLFPGSKVKQGTSMEDSENEEKQRLLYVATNRAADRITYCTAVINQGADRPHSHFLELVAEHLEIIEINAKEDGLMDE